MSETKLQQNRKMSNISSLSPFDILGNSIPQNKKSQNILATKIDHIKTDQDSIPEADTKESQFMRVSYLRNMLFSKDSHALKHNPVHHKMNYKHISNMNKHLNVISLPSLKASKLQ
mmetsp:Transcript_7714/g.6829  ORF Transcript_7714/g.6829 Transcript_7714/m.6829 type:complete len:116 (+) Transcript_7714:2-349(+)